jgi:hypothetical protein
MVPVGGHQQNVSAQGVHPTNPSILTKQYLGKRKNSPIIAGNSRPPLKSKVECIESAPPLNSNGDQERYAFTPKNESTNKGGIKIGPGETGAPPNKPADNDKLKRFKYPALCQSCKKEDKECNAERSCNHCKWPEGCNNEKLAKKSLCAYHNRVKQTGLKKMKREVDKPFKPPILHYKTPFKATAASKFWKEAAPPKPKYEVYCKTQDSVEVVLHRYASIQYFHNPTFTTVTRGSKTESFRIRVLADGVHGTFSNQCHPFPGLLEDIRQDTVEKIKERCNFKHVANFAKHKGESPFSRTFKAASLHLQDPLQSNKTNFYNFHKDKLPSFICFYQLSGVSFTFVALPTANPSREAAFDTTTESWGRYEQWKTWTDDSSMAQIYEDDFLKCAGKGLMVKVYELQAGWRLCFDGHACLHGSIIPKQVESKARNLLVFHDLDVTSGHGGG